MNEQLVVKNFGPIKDATVDFKRVTVFIGPTGGGKSTLAKLAAISREGSIEIAARKVYKIKTALENFSISNYVVSDSAASWRSNNSIKMDFLFAEAFSKEENSASNPVDNDALTAEVDKFLLEKIVEIQALAEGKSKEPVEDILHRMRDKIVSGLLESIQSLGDRMPVYIPSERTFVAAVGYSWPGLLRDDIGLPKTVLDFANSFSNSRKDITELEISFLAAKYLHRNGQDFIQVPGVETLFRLYETASGIQSVTPLLVLLEHLNRNIEQAKSFIIEEPELNLYPTAQRDLVYWLLEKCTQGENDLTITTHSPYVLSALNLALYANKVAELFPHQRQKVAKIIPAKYWLKADEFSAYHVAGGGVKSIFDKKTGLLSESQLDEVSGHFADVFDRLTDLRVLDKKAPAKAKSLNK